MTLDSIDIKAAVEAVEKQLQEDKQTSAAMKSAVSLILIVVKLLMARLGMNSRNSSVPPASDPNRVKKPRSTSGRKPGGQPDHNGSTLMPVEDPDEVRALNIDKRTLPRGEYQEIGFERRQIIDLRIERYVTEFRAQILANAQGQRFVAPFPAGVTRPAQYGASVKANAVSLVSG